MAKKKTPTKTTRTRKAKTASRASRSPKKSPKKKVAKKKVSTKPASAKSARASKKAAKDGEMNGANEVTIDRRRKSDRRAEEAAPEKQAMENPVAKKPPLERRKKVSRRRQIDPTTCERDYSEPEIEFMNALDDYKRKSGRMFPTCSELLEVIRGLGYVQLSPVELVARQPNPPAEPQTVDTSSEPILTGFDSSPVGPLGAHSDLVLEESDAMLEELVP